MLSFKLRIREKILLHRAKRFFDEDDKRKTFTNNDLLATERGTTGSSFAASISLFEILFFNPRRWI